MAEWAFRVKTPRTQLRSAAWSPTLLHTSPGIARLRQPVRLRRLLRLRRHLQELIRRPGDLALQAAISRGAVSLQYQFPDLLHLYPSELLPVVETLCALEEGATRRQMLHLWRARLEEHTSE